MMCSIQKNDKNNYPHMLRMTNFWSLYEANNYKMIETPIILRNNGIDRIPHLKPFKDGLRHVKLILKLKRNTKK